jgi:hypothetical protein
MRVDTTDYSPDSNWPVTDLFKLHVGIPPGVITHMVMGIKLEDSFDRAVYDL